MPIVIDATNAILGRLASETAKILLGKEKNISCLDKNGNKISFKPNQDDLIYIINADKAVITGNPRTTTQRYLQRMHIKTLTNPRRGPFHPRQPEAIVRRAVRGMIPWKKSRGKELYHRLRVYVGTPAETDADQAIHFPHVSVEGKMCKRITVGELARRISTFDQRIKMVQ